MCCRNIATFMETTGFSCRRYTPGQTGLRRIRRKSCIQRWLAHGNRGAEVILHSSSEVGSPRPTPKNIAKCARAYENMCYVISSNTSAIHNSPVPQNSTQGHSQIVDFKGQVMTEAYAGESMVGHALSISNAFGKRAETCHDQSAGRQRLSLFRSTYEQPHFTRRITWSTKKARSRCPTGRILWGSNPP